jgi:transcriptional regulator with XRE-family HTH domain
VLASVKTLTQKPLHRRHFGQALRKRRESLGLSQEKLAEIADCHRNYIGLVERGEQNISIDMMVRLAKALKSTIANLMREADL